MIYITKSFMMGIVLSTLVVGASIGGVYFLGLDKEDEGLDLSTLQKKDLFQWAREGTRRILYMYGIVSPGTSEYPHIADGLYIFDIIYNMSGDGDWTLTGESNLAANSSQTALIVRRGFKLNISESGEDLANSILMFEGNGTYLEDYDYQPGDDWSAIPDPYGDKVNELEKSGLSFSFTILFEGTVVRLQLFPRGIFIGIGPASVERNGVEELISEKNVDVFYEEELDLSYYIPEYYFVDIDDYTSVLQLPFIQGLNSSIYNTLE